MADRFWAKVQKGDGCWLWMAAKDKWGYGKFKVESRRQRVAHRVAYELVRGPVPDGLELDHLCRNPSCVNPEHLEPVTSAENTRRSESISTRNSRKTHCARGHEFTPENIYWERGRWRHCRTCRAAVQAGRQAGKQAGR